MLDPIFFTVFDLGNHLVFILKDLRGIAKIYEDGYRGREGGSLDDLKYRLNHGEQRVFICAGGGISAEYYLRAVMQTGRYELVHQTIDSIKRRDKNRYGIKFRPGDIAGKHIILRQGSGDSVLTDRHNYITVDKAIRFGIDEVNRMSERFEEYI